MYWATKNGCGGVSVEWTRKAEPTEGSVTTEPAARVRAPLTVGGLNATCAAVVPMILMYSIGPPLLLNGGATR